MSVYLKIKEVKVLIRLHHLLRLIIKLFVNVIIVRAIKYLLPSDWQVRIQHVKGINVLTGW